MTTIRTSDPSTTILVYKNKQGVAVEILNDDHIMGLAHLDRYQAVALGNAIIENCSPPLFSTIIVQGLPNED